MLDGEMEKIEEQRNDNQLKLNNSGKIEIHINIFQKCQAKKDLKFFKPFHVWNI